MISISAIHIICATKPSMDQQNLDQLHFDQRQIYGSFLCKIFNSKIFLHGVTRLGMEVAKNIVMSNPKRLTILDTPIGPRLNQSMSQQHNWQNNETSGQASIESLRQLNKQVEILEIKALPGIDMREIVRQHDCIVIIDNYDLDYVQQCNQICRQAQVKFVYGGCLGLHGFIFNDFGPEFRVHDPDGEEPYSYKIEHISKQTQAVVSIFDYQTCRKSKHGDVLQFDEVQGMDGINGKQFTISPINSHQFYIGDTTTFSPYLSGGTATRVENSFVLHHFPLKQSLTRLSHQPNPPSHFWPLHIILLATFQFFSIHKRVPQNSNINDAEQLLKLAKNTLSNLKLEGNYDLTQVQLDEGFVRNISMCSQTQIHPLTSYFGGIISQQILKTSGKFTPVDQWWHHCFIELVPDLKINMVNDKKNYGDYLVLLGEQLLGALQSSKCLILGEGGNSELIRMLANMGVGSRQNGTVFYVDSTLVAQENLSLHSLFKEEDIGHPVSEVLCQAGTKINPACSFQPINSAFSKHNEIFDQSFFANIDFVICTVKSSRVESQIETLCVEYEKPLFQLGTDSCKGSVVPVVPFKTGSLADFSCKQTLLPLFDYSKTLNFPYLSQHAVHFSKITFSDLFEDKWEKLAMLYHDRNAFVKSQVETAWKNKQDLKIIEKTVRELKQLYFLNESKSYQSCINLTVKWFYELFNQKIARLLRSFPPNYIYENSNLLFWSGLKKVPKPIRLSVEDGLHLLFIDSTSKILASLIEVDASSPNELTKKVILRALKDYQQKIQEETQKGSCKGVIELSEFEQKKRIQDSYSELLTLPVQREKAPRKISLNRNNPEKLHASFIFAASNLRARNYGIKQLSSDKVKTIAFMMIPKAITTTCTTIGALGVEIIKSVMNKKKPNSAPVHAFNCNLALPLMLFSSPLPPTQIIDKEFDPIMMGPLRAMPSKFTKWEKLELKGPMTIQEVQEKIQRDYKVQVNIIIYGDKCLFNEWSKSLSAYCGRDVQDVAEQLSGVKMPASKKTILLTVCGTDLDEGDCQLPDIKYHL